MRGKVLACMLLVGCASASVQVVGGGPADDDDAGRATTGGGSFVRPRADASVADAAPRCAADAAAPLPACTFDASVPSPDASDDAGACHVARTSCDDVPDGGACANACCPDEYYVSCWTGPPNVQTPPTGCRELLPSPATREFCCPCR